MDEKKQSLQHDATRQTSTVWGTAALAILLLLLNIYGITTIFANATNVIALTGRILLGLNIVVLVVSAVFIIRRQQEKAFVLTFLVGLLLAAENIFLVQGRAIPTSIALSIVAVVGFFWLCPPQWKRRIFILSALTLGLIWVVEWLNPAWRIESSARQVGPSAVVAFVVVFAVVLFFQATRKSIRTRLIYGFLMVTIFPLVVTAVFNDRNTRTALTDDANQALRSAALQTAAQVDSFIETRLNATRSEAQFSVVIDYILLPAGERPGSPEEERVKKFIYARLSEDPVFINSVGISDINGITLIDTLTSEIGENKLNHSWFQNAIATGLPYASNVEYSRTSGKPSIYFSAPVRDSAGRIIGVIRTRYDAAILQSILTSEVKFAGETSFPILIDAESHLRLAHGTNAALVYKTIIPQDPISVETLQERGLLPAGTPEEISTNLPGFASALLAYETQPFFTSKLVTLEQTGEQRGAIVKTQHQNWLVVYAVSEDEFMAPINAQARGSILLTLLAGVVVAAFALFIAQSLANPIARLTQTAEAISAGDITMQAKVETEDEIGTLAATFNRMTHQLREFINSLESRVAERTRNLELAAEVGRTVSQVRALDVMLTDAAELIRKQFDLYYVQVYLVNPSQTYLNLQAGTGRVGEQLLGRHHRLPFNAESINGRAAIEKKSIVISNTTANPTFKPNPLLPDTRSEMAVPLLIGDRAVGVLDMQSQYAGALNPDLLSAFEALAGQLAIAIQNANFLAETELARAEVEAQAKRLTRASWSDYLDAIHKPEETGFVFEKNKLMPLSEDLEVEDGAKVVPFSVTGEQLGNLVVELEGQSPIARTDELLNTVARQVSQQIENLRLLDSAERYRFEAEQASRRLTREGWKSYVDQTDENLSYLYDLKEVRPQNDELPVDGYTLPIKVRDESIGKLVVQGLEATDTESVSIASSVAERLATHIESLRLFDQTQTALVQSERLFEASSHLTQASDLQELVSTAVSTLGISVVNRALLTTFQYGTSGDIEQLTIIGNWWNQTGHEPTPIGTRYSREVIRVMPMFVSPTPVFFNDAFEDERVDATTMELVKRLNLRAVAILPLYSSNKQIGALILEGEEAHKFTQQEIQLFGSLAPQIATILENRRQFEQAQKQAEREAMLNVINQKIQSATSVEAVLQIAARELGHALGAPMTIAQLSVKDRSS